MIKENKTKLVCVFSPSHKILLEKYFLPSISDDIDIQLYDSGIQGKGYYMDSDWVNNVLYKCSIIIKTIRENPGEIFIYSDVDIVFFRPFKDRVLSEMKNRDMVCHLDDGIGTFCSGFFGIRSNRLTLELWDSVYQAIQTEYRDQFALNRLILQNKYLRVGYLSFGFYGAGTYSTRIMTAKDRLYFPYKAFMFHANYTLGLENKVWLLEKALKLYHQPLIFKLVNNFLFKSDKRNQGRVEKVINLISSYNKKREEDSGVFPMPRNVCIDASTICQLKCVSCPNADNSINNILGSGVLSVINFQHFIREHPWTTWIELSNWGEIFLNPELKDILEFSNERNIRISIANGSNMNTISEEAMDALVRYKVDSITCSIDGATMESYSKYRINGDFEKVIKNIKRINELKQKYQCDLPKLKWQFIAFGHNEHEIADAKAMAQQLDMKFYLKLSWEDLYNQTFSPVINKDVIRMESGLGVASRSEFAQKYKQHYIDKCCRYFFKMPHINFDGKLLGCGVNHWTHFGNVFQEGLQKLIESDRYQYTIKVLMGQAPLRDDIPCSQCKVFKYRSTYNSYITDEHMENIDI